MRLMIFALAVLFLIGFVSAAIPGDCESSTVVYWKFDGDAIDSVGENDGIRYGSGENEIW